MKKYNLKLEVTANSLPELIYMANQELKNSDCHKDDIKKTGFFHATRIDGNESASDWSFLEEKQHYKDAKEVYGEDNEEK